MTVCRTFSSTARMAPEQALLVGDHLVLHALVEVTGCLDRRAGRAPARPGTLHVDEQDGGLPAANGRSRGGVVGAG